MTAYSEMRLCPLMKIVLPMIAGIIIGNHCFCYQNIYICIAGLVVTAALSIAVYRYALLNAVAIISFFLFLGCFLIVDKTEDENIIWRKGDAVYKAVVIDVPQIKDKTVVCDVRLLNAGNESHKSFPLVRATMARDSRSEGINVGNGIAVRSTVVKPFNYHKGGGFDYAQYLKDHGFSGVMFVYGDRWSYAMFDISGMSLFDRTSIKFLEIRNSILEKYRMSGFGNQEYAVFSALTLGDKSHLDSHTKNIYSVAGASHILALSGLHLGIIYAILTMLTFGYKRKIISQSLIILSIWAFVLMVGMSQSVVRSAVMLTIYSFISLLNRNSLSLSTLSLTAIIMLLFNPQSLFDIGFELSFLAVLSIICFYPYIYNIIDSEYLYNHQAIHRCWQLAAVSVSAQIGTSPLVAYCFGRFSCYFLLTNFIVIPLSTVIIYAAFFLFLFTFLPFVQHIIAWLLLRMITFMNASLGFISALPGASVENLSPSLVDTSLIYIIIMMAYFYMRYRSTRQLFVLSVTALSVVLVMVVEKLAMPSYA